MCIASDAYYDSFDECFNSNNVDVSEEQHSWMNVYAITDSRIKASKIMNNLNLKYVHNLTRSRWLKNKKSHFYSAPRSYVSLFCASSFFGILTLRTVYVFM